MFAALRHRPGTTESRRMAAGPFAKSHWTVFFGAIAIAIVIAAVGDPSGLGAIRLAVGLIDTPVDQLGSALGLRNLIVALSPILFALLADARNMSNVLRIGTLFLASGWLLLAMAPASAEIHASFDILIGFGLAACGPVLLNSAVARAAPEGSRALWLAIFIVISPLFSGAAGPMSFWLRNIVAHMAEPAGARMSTGLYYCVIALAIFPIARVFRQEPVHASRPHWSDRPVSTLKVAGTTVAFWSIGGLMLLSGFANTALTANLLSYLMTVGSGSSILGAPIGIAGWAFFPSAIAFGWAARRWRHKMLVVLVLALQLIGVVTIVLSAHQSGIFIGALLAVGISSNGVVMILCIGLLADKFGTRNLATTISIPMILGTLGGWLGLASGPLFDQVTGSDTDVFYGLVLSSAIGVLLAWRIDDSPLPQPADEALAARFE